MFIFRHSGLHHLQPKDLVPHLWSLLCAIFPASKKHFKECISFIHQCRLHGGNCLVHW